MGALMIKWVLAQFKQCLSSAFGILLQCQVYVHIDAHTDTVTDTDTHTDTHTHKHTHVAYQTKITIFTQRPIRAQYTRTHTAKNTALADISVISSEEGENQRECQRKERQMDEETLKS